MDVITEEILTNLIKRVERLESTGIKPNYPNKTGIATEKQLDLIRRLGGICTQGMTKQEAGNQIDKLIKEQNNKQFEKPNEPKEVDTDDAGLDEEDLM